MFSNKTLINFILILVLLVVLANTMGQAIGLNGRALILVLSGTLITVLIRYGVSGLADALRATSRLKGTIESPVEITLRADSLAEKTRQNGITVLEDHEDENAHFQEGLDLALAGTEPEEVNQVLAEKMEADLNASTRGCMVFRTIAESAPVFGLLGTLAGFVVVLSNPDDPSGLDFGITMTVMSTVYGILLAYLIALPIADLLEKRCGEKAQCYRAILDGLVGVQRGSRLRAPTENDENEA